MNSGKLLDDFDVIFAIVVAQITLEKIILALYARHTDPPSDLWCAYGFVDPLAAPLLPQVWAYPLAENLHVRKFAFLPLGRLAIGN